MTDYCTKCDDICIDESGLVCDCVYDYAAHELTPKENLLIQLGAIVVFFAIPAAIFYAFVSSTG